MRIGSGGRHVAHARNDRRPKPSVPGAQQPRVTGRPGHRASPAARATSMGGVRQRWIKHSPSEGGSVSSPGLGRSKPKTPRAGRRGYAGTCGDCLSCASHTRTRGRGDRMSPAFRAAPLTPSAPPCGPSPPLGTIPTPREISPRDHLLIGTSVDHANFSYPKVVKKSHTRT